MTIEDELRQRGAPPNVLEAGREIDKMQVAKLPPRRHHVIYVQDWVARQHGQNRWGR